ncbi:hypothetical protein U1Q18_001949 [Sarracenia purpurea var. burkii]
MASLEGSSIRWAMGGWSGSRLIHCRVISSLGVFFSDLCWLASDIYATLEDYLEESAARNLESMVSDSFEILGDSFEGVNFSMLHSSRVQHGEQDALYIGGPLAVD